MKKAATVNRRCFMGSMSGTAALAAASTSGSSAKAAEPQFVTEPPRKTPIVRQVDVLVVGGADGVELVLPAAKEGVLVLVLERFGMLGGVWTSADF